MEAAPNLLYRTMLMLLYATGLRRAEAANLKVSDIDSARMLIHVHQGNGSRDRELPPSIFVRVADNPLRATVAGRKRV
jgi:integrase